MNVCGIICEYNPFHMGHAYQIREIRRILGEDTAIICAMSGNFVQRGEAAAYEKHERAEAAVRCGADLVIELPLPWAMAPAEVFARGGVGLLAATGILTHLAFGCETPNLSRLFRINDCLADPRTETLLMEKLQRGISYASARQEAAEEIFGSKIPELHQPNDILALEYLKALKQSDSEIRPTAIRRIGASHDSGDENAIPSASFLREKLFCGQEISRWLPEEAAAVFGQGRGPVNRERLEIAILSRLRFLTAQDIASVPDVAEGLEQRIVKAIEEAAGLEEITDRAVTKRYSRARVRRILLSAALKLTKEDQDGIPPYLRILALNATGTELVRMMAGKCTQPVVTKPAELRKIGGKAEHIFSLTASGTDLFAIAYLNSTDRICGSDWRSGPTIVK